MSLFFDKGALSEARQMDNDKRTNIIFFMMIYFRLFKDNLFSAVFTTDGSYLENNNIKNIGNTTDNIGNFFDFKDL